MSELTFCWKVESETKWFRAEILQPLKPEGWKGHPYNRVRNIVWVKKQKVSDDGVSKIEYVVFSGSHYNLPERLTEAEAKSTLKSVRRHGKIVWATSEEEKFIKSQLEWALSS